MSPARSLTLARALVLLWLGAFAGFAAGLEWYRTRPGDAPAPSGGIDLVGAGATFPYPLYRRWFAEYHDEVGVRINYFSIGSGEGIRLLFEREVDFGASDRPLLATERARARCGPVEIPTAVGAIAVVVNLPRIANAVRLDASALAGIYRGRIARWDHPALRALNPSLALPSMPILAVHRARTSGTSEVFADYLATAEEWTTAAEDGVTGRFVGSRAEGNEGVAAEVRAREGSLGFVEFSYAQQLRLSTAALRNIAGNFVRPDTASLEESARELLANARADTLHGLVGARGANAYPIVAITRIIVDDALGDAKRGAHILAFARWALRNGGGAAKALGYAPLPPAELRRQMERLDSLAPGRCPLARTT